MKSKNKIFIDKIIEWANDYPSYLSSRGDYARGYKKGIFLAKDQVNEMITEYKEGYYFNDELSGVFWYEDETDDGKESYLYCQLSDSGKYRARKIIEDLVLEQRYNDWEYFSEMLSECLYNEYNIHAKVSYKTDHNNFTDFDFSGSGRYSDKKREEICSYLEDVAWRYLNEIDDYDINSYIETNDVFFDEYGNILEDDADIYDY